MKYIPFNVKTDYSFLGSLIKINDLNTFCVKENIKYLAVCDNNLSSAIDIIKLCQTNKIQYSIGCEFEIDNFIINVYALTYEGYLNLLKVNTLKEKNELTLESLKKHSKDLSCVLDYAYILEYEKLSFFNNLFIGYHNELEKSKCINITSNVIFNKKIKCLSSKDNEYFKYLNMLGGENNLVNTFHIEKVDAEKNREYMNFFDKVNIVFPEKKLFIPSFCNDDLSYLKKLSNLGLKKRLGEINQIYQNRLDYELSIINKMGYTSYFLIVYDYVCYAKKNNILVGPGRGSAAGSLVCYAIGITNIDPIKYDLLFERFLNVDRISMPDIDIDFDSQKREDIITYVRNKYSNEKVAVGSSFNTFKTKLVLREVSKIKKIDSYLFEKFLKNINRNLSLTDNLKNEVVSKYLKTYPEIKEIYKISMKFENLKKNISTHAAGVVISSQEIDTVIPIIIDNDKYKTGFSMDNLEDLGLLKMDFLGLKNLSVIANILEETKVDINSIPLNDLNVINIFKTAKTDGIFQFETSAMKKLLKKQSPDSFDELIAAVALVRPGPSDFLEEYIYNKKNQDKIIYLKNTKSILENTFGIILYQEQIIKILNVVGGFSNSKADLIRRAIAKKKSDVIKSIQTEFVNNAIERGYKKEEADNLFRKIEKFANYGFNKSHSVAYALIAYQMAYLKHYYPINFVKQMLSFNKDKTFVEGYLNEMKDKGIFPIKPDVNFSKKDFSFYKDRLVLPLNLIKSINSVIEDEIINNAPYEDLFDFLIKNKNLNKDVVKNLIYSGAFRSFKYNIKTLLKNLENAYIYAELNGYGEKPYFQEYDEFSNKELSDYEYDMFGFYISNHPSAKYKDGIMKIKDKNANLFKNVNMVVKLDKKTSIKTKKNTDMAFLAVSDETGSADITVFSKKYELVKNLKNGSLLQIQGKVSKNQDKTNIILEKLKEVEK